MLVHFEKWRLKHGEEFFKPETKNKNTVSEENLRSLDLKQENKDQD
jgi:actin-related protein